MPLVRAADLIRSVGLLVDGPVAWGHPVRSAKPGVYVVELPAPLPSAPLDHTVLRHWIERVSTLRLEGAVPSTLVSRPPSVAPAARRGRVLVVDDDPAIRDLVSRVLQTDGWEVVSAENGRVACERVSEQMPSVILLDLMMPDVSGYDVLRELTLTDRGFLLNGERRFLAGGFHEGLYPGTIAYPPDEAFARKKGFVINENEYPLPDAPAARRHELARSITNQAAQAIPYLERIVQSCPGTRYASAAQEYLIRLAGSAANRK